MRIELDVKLDYSDVLLRPKRSMLQSKKDLTLTRKFKFVHSPHIWEGIPLMASPMDGVGTFSMARSLQDFKIITAIKKDYTIRDWFNAYNTGINPEYLAITVGTGRFFDKKANDYVTMKKILKEVPVRIIVVDVANFYIQSSTEFLKILRDDFPDHIIMAGNIATSDIAEYMIFAGADVVRVGIGPGSACTTRIKAGVGFPQFSAVVECADTVHGIYGHVIADGGCTNPGDVMKALAAGGDFVMLGSMLAAHDECEEEIAEGKVRFYGMSSEAARERHGGRKDGYQSNEGRVLELPCRGPVSHTVDDILGGITSGMMAIGSKRLKDIPKCATFVKVNHTHSKWLHQYDVDRRYD